MDCILSLRGGALARVRQPEAAEAAHGRRLGEQAGRQERRHLRRGRDGTTGRSLFIASGSVETLSLTVHFILQDGDDVEDIQGPEGGREGRGDGARVGEVSRNGACKDVQHGLPGTKINPILVLKYDSCFGKCE